MDRSMPFFKAGYSVPIPPFLFKKSNDALGVSNGYSNEYLVQSIQCMKHFIFINDEDSE